MQQSNTWKIKLTALSVASALTFTAYASEEAEVKKTDAASETPAIEKSLDLGGSLTLGYNTNIFDKEDHRSVRGASWSGSLNTSFQKDYSAFIRTGGRRSLEDETGDFWTDSVIGVSRSNLFNFGESGKVSLSGQFTIPTSETSQKDNLQTALRLALPITAEAIGVDFSLTPRLRKNFHEYKTAGQKALTEWVYSLSFGASYSWEKLTLSSSVLGGNSISYFGTRRNNVNYEGNVALGYKFNDAMSLSLSASTSGVYADAERGTLGNIDLFNDDKATFSASATFSF